MQPSGAASASWLDSKGRGTAHGTGQSPAQVSRVNENDPSTARWSWTQLWQHPASWLTHWPFLPTARTKAHTVHTQLPECSNTTTKIHFTLWQVLVTVYNSVRGQMQQSWSREAWTSCTTGKLPCLVTDRMCWLNILAWWITQSNLLETVLFLTVWCWLPPLCPQIPTGSVAAGASATTSTVWVATSNCGLTAEMTHYMFYYLAQRILMGK